MSILAAFASLFARSPLPYRWIAPIVAGRVRKMRPGLRQTHYHYCSSLAVEISGSNLNDPRLLFLKRWFASSCDPVVDDEGYRAELSKQVQYDYCANLRININRLQHTVSKNDPELRDCLAIFASQCMALEENPEYQAALSQKLGKQQSRRSSLRPAPDIFENPPESLRRRLSDRDTANTQRAMLREASRLTPLAEIHQVIGNLTVPWLSDGRDTGKAYAMACLSELAYLYLPEHERFAQHRYKFFWPSAAHAELRRIRVNLLPFVAPVADIGVDPFDTGNYVYLMIHLRGMCVVAVRGTASLSDWMMNFRAHKRTTLRGTFHCGFLEEVEFALPQLAERIPKDVPVTFTGHSMGAAVAALLSRHWRPQTQVLTPYVFACPRFAIEETAALVPRFSYGRASDVVPHVPPRFIGYSDSGSAVETVPQGARRLHGAACGVIAIDQLFANHNMEGYRQLLGDQLVLGDQLDRHFADTVYIDTLIQILKRERKDRR